MAHHMSAQHGNGGRGARRLWLVPAVVVGVVAALYLAGVVAFHIVFMPDTTLDGTDVSLKSVSDVAAEKGASLAQRRAHVFGNGIDLDVTGSDVNLVCDGEGYARAAISQLNAWAWPAEAFRDHELAGEEALSFDRDRLFALLEPFVEESRRAADEIGGGGISYDPEAGAYVLDERVAAQHLDKDAVAAALEAAFARGEDEVEIGTECLTTDSAPQDAVARANAYVAATCQLTLAGQEASEVTSDRIAGWVVIGEDLSVTLDAAAVEAWCRGELSDLLDTVGSERTYTRPDGTAITVNDGPAPYGRSPYGWIIDGAAAADQIVAAIQAGEPATIELPTIQQAAQVNPGGQDWGDRYIDVDLTRQHAVFYDGGEVIWEADITSGQPNLGNETPTGVWIVDSRKSRATDGDINLKGPIDPETGKPEWDSHVDFWVGFVGNGGSRNGNLIGFHNAPWQYAAFGGNTYTWNGSHGCVRLNYAGGEALYNVVQKGDVVVVHK